MVSSVGLLLAALGHTPAAHAEGASVINASKSQRREASHSYKKALDAFEAKRFDEALPLLENSYNAVASPNSLLLIGRTLAQMGREPEAYVKLERVIALAQELAKVDEKYTQTEESAKKELAELSKKVALVTIKPGASVTLGNEEVHASDWGRGIPRKPGKLEVSVRQADGEQTTTELDLSAGESAEVSTAPPPKKEKTKLEAPAPSAPAAPRQEGVHPRTLAYVSGAIGMAGLATFGAFHYLHQNTDDRAGCGAQLCPTQTVSEAEKSSSYQTLAFVGLGVGAVGLISATYFFVNSGETPPDEKPAVDLAVAPRQILVHGTF